MPMYIAYTEYSKPNKIHPNLGMLDYFYLYNTHQSIASHAIGQRVTPFVAFDMIFAGDWYSFILMIPYFTPRRLDQYHYFALFH